MKKLIDLIFKRRTDSRLTQKELLEFILDEKTIDKAVQGSMNKRNELIERVRLAQKHA